MSYKLSYNKNIKLYYIVHEYISLNNNMILYIQFLQKIC